MYKWTQAAQSFVVQGSPLKIRGKSDNIAEIEKKDVFVREGYVCGGVKYGDGIGGWGDWYSAGWF